MIPKLVPILPTSTLKMESRLTIPNLKDQDRMPGLNFIEIERKSGADGLCLLVMH